MTDLGITTRVIDGIPTGVYITDGERDPVVLLHGWGQEIASMLPIANRLTALGYPCHILDLPGFGITSAPRTVWDVPRYAAFVNAYLQQAKLKQVNLIGHSFGGRISIVLGADYPQVVDKIVLTDSAGVRPKTSPRMQAYYATRKVIFTVLRLPLLKRFDPPVRRWFQRRFGSEDYQNALHNPMWLETFKAIINQDLVPFAKRIAAPTLLIWGENDDATPLYQAKILESAIPDAGLVVFDGAGHYAYLERPVEFVRIVDTFFGG